VTRPETTKVSSVLTSFEADREVLIFSNSVRLLKMVAEFISSDCTSNRFQAHSTVSYPFEILTGEVSIDDRMAMVDRFQDPNQDQYILLISTMAGGVGLNLTAVWVRPTIPILTKGQ
jgi:SNF2 family DNA or RNA helicase